MSKLDIKISCQSDYVLVERPDSYEVNPKNHFAELEKIQAFCNKVKCQKVLMVGSQTKIRLSTMDIFNIGQEITRMGLKIAVVESHDESIDNTEFLETVAYNRGGAIQFFNSILKAEHWLQES